MADRSPYATNTNPTIYLLIHIVGSLFGAPRSLNARLTVEMVPPMIAGNAAMVALARHDYADYSLLFVEEIALEQLKYMKAEAGEIVNDQDRNTWTAAEWLRHYNYKFPPTDRLRLMQLIGQIRNVRA